MDSLGVGRRIKDLRGELMLSQQVFAERIGISQPTLSQIEREAIDVADHVLTSIAYRFNVQMDWILNGAGEMFVYKQTSGVPYYSQFDINEPEMFLTLPELAEMNVENYKAYKYPSTHIVANHQAIINPGDIIIMRPLAKDEPKPGIYVCCFYQSDLLRVGCIRGKDEIIFNELILDSGLDKPDEKKPTSDSMPILIENEKIKYPNDKLKIVGRLLLSVKCKRHFG